MPAPNFRGGVPAPNLGGGIFSGGGCLLQIFGGGVPAPNFGGGIFSGGGACSKFSGGGYFSGGGGLHRNTVNVRPVRILLECILVVLCNLLKLPYIVQ